VCGNIQGATLDEYRLLILASYPDELPGTSRLLRTKWEILRLAGGNAAAKIGQRKEESYANDAISATTSRRRILMNWLLVVNWLLVGNLASSDNSLRCCARPRGEPSKVYSAPKYSNPAIEKK